MGERSLQSELDRVLSPRLGYRPSRWPETLYLHVRERAAAAGQRAEEYLESVLRSGDPTALGMLIDAATIGHTAAYRHPEQIEQLKSVIAGLGKRRPGPLRIWCAGCSTGEEAFSLAHAARSAGVQVTVLATDVNPVAIAVARSGRLPRRSAAGGSVPRDWSEIVPEALRKLVRFEVASLTDPRPALDAGPFQIIFCRNVLIYFERDEVPRMLARLAGELVLDGYLVTSPAEGILPLPPGLQRGPSAGWLQLDREDKRQKAMWSPPSTSLPERATPPLDPAAPSAEAAQAAQIEEAVRLLGAGRAEEAEQILSELLNGDPEHLVGWFLLGEALLARGERAQARAAFLRATRSARGALPDIDADALRRAAIRRASALGDPSPAW